MPEPKHEQLTNTHSAFPLAGWDTGMSLRTYMATAIHAAIAGQNWMLESREGIADEAVRQADALIDALNSIKPRV